MSSSLFKFLDVSILQHRDPGLGLKDYGPPLLRLYCNDDPVVRPSINCRDTTVQVYNKRVDECE